MRATSIALLAALVGGMAGAAEPEARFSGEKQRNNFVSDLLEVASSSKTGGPFTFGQRRDGWIFISANGSGTGRARVFLDRATRADPVLVCEGRAAVEAMRFARKGLHTIQVEAADGAKLEHLAVRAIPELVHCGLGFNPAIKGYGAYDLNFLKADILPNVTTLVVPSNFRPPEGFADDWHRQGKTFIAEVGINGPGKTVEDHLQHWGRFYDQAPFLDGILINEFIVNNPATGPGMTLSPERQQRMELERQRYVVYAEALTKLRADPRYQNKSVYTYVGGSGKKLNQEVIGTNFIQTLIANGCRIALERYLHEMSSELGAAAALQLFVDGIADWEAKAPGVKERMVIAFGLFSMPPGGLNKLPNVDYHVWMDQQMNAAANHPALAGLGGLEWWTTSQTDEETVRFVGRLYRHYAIEGKTNRLTRDPLFLTHLQNTDFEKGTAGWALHEAEAGSIAVKSFPRYGRIEGRFMGLGRPPDPEHIGDTFLWMKRSEKGPNTFAQTIQDLQPGRLYSLKMFSCDYDDLVNPKPRKPEDIKTKAAISMEGVEVDTKRSFAEVYPSNPEPKIPVCITYYWMVFRAKAPTAKLTVSDWQSEREPGGPAGVEQAFNFLELEPYHD
jgi:hypothetical protein